MWDAAATAVRDRYRALGRRFEAAAAGARRERASVPELWSALAAEGFFATTLPPAAERFDLTAAAFEGLLYGACDSGVASAAVIHHCACSIAGRHGGAALVERFRARHLGGPCSIAMTEPHGGSAAFDMQARLSVEAGGLRLRGEKWHITNAPCASAYIVFAFDERARAPSAVLVERGADGVACEPLRPSGMRAAQVGRLTFDTLVPEAHVLGRPGEGVAIFQDATIREKVLIAFATVGILSRVLEHLVDWVHSRTSSGQSIARFQYVRGRVTDVLLGLETTRGLAHAALRRCLAGEDASLEAALAKWHAAEHGIEASLHAMKLMGSHGFEEGGLADLLLGSVGASLGGGTEEAQREIAYKALYVRHRRAAPRDVPADPKEGR